jgi:hypothetical protein
MWQRYYAWYWRMWQSSFVSAECGSVTMPGTGECGSVVTVVSVECGSVTMPDTAECGSVTIAEAVDVLLPLLIL